MGLLGSIMEKLGFSTASAMPPTASSAPQTSQAHQTASKPSSTAPVGRKEVDVMAKLEGMAAAHKEKLNWKTSIVDLMKLLGLDSSLAARKELATELGCPAQKMGDSAQMNVWLHKTVLQKLADNGGNIPKELLLQTNSGVRP
jgi:hypothetical protein